VYAVKVGNGSISLSDLSNYSTVLDLSQKRTFGDFSVIVPISFGGTFLLQALESIQVSVSPKSISAGHNLHMINIGECPNARV